MSDRYRDEVVFYGAYIDYTAKRYDAAEEGFGKTLQMPAFHQASRYYLAEIMLETKGYVEAEEMAKAFAAGASP